jgi:replicative DNA helicase
VNAKSIAATSALEAGILSAILFYPDVITSLPTLETDDFFDARYRAVFGAMRNLEASGAPIDCVTVVAAVAKWTGHHDTVTMEFLGALLLDVPSAPDAREYARQLRQTSLARRVSLQLSEVITEGGRKNLDGGEMLSMAQAAISRLDEDQPDSAVSISTLVQKRIRQLEQIAGEKAKGHSIMSGFPSGVATLDEKIAGLQPGIVTIVAARPGMGKSSLGLSIADGASKAGFGVHLFSLEDTEEAYSDRALSRTSQVPAESLRNADLSNGQASDLMLAAHSLKGRRWIVDGRSGVTAEEIVRSVRRHKRSNATCVVIVDYVQLVKRPARMSPHEALSEIVTTLADAAKQDRLAYVVMSQLNRQVEQRQDRRPQLSDLRESGALEERAKCVIGIYRGAYYGPPIKGIDYADEWKNHAYEPGQEEHDAQVQLLVLKNSNGRTGTAWATWNGPTTRIS